MVLKLSKQHNFLMLPPTSAIEGFIRVNLLPSMTPSTTRLLSFIIQ